MNIFMIRVLIAVTLLSLLVAVAAVYLLVRERARTSPFGVYYKVHPRVGGEIRELARKRFTIVHNIYELLYCTCNYYPKYKDKLADYLVKEFMSGGIRNLSNDIVYIADLGEGGNLSRIAREYRLTEAELKTCCYIHLGFKWQQTCTAENLTENAYNVRCSRIRKKLSLGKDEKIPDFIEQFCIRHS